ncbi:Rv3235 family protein [Rothia aerolata]|uniref:Uncharacterized protein n=1 Tax=Rothia aerolata TaxID=1812262 RepID=A0A917MRF1_9MICC|nr:Rv3235 family protein [Rothia aerolata]GGH59506.1 hypothetical protein GCM10007359_06750 [Rothia aerolata]
MIEPQPSREFNRFMAVSAEEYAKFRQKVLDRETSTRSAGIALAPTDTECRSIEVMCAGLSVALLEVFAGRRPAAHLAKWLSQDCYQKVVNRSRITKQSLRRTYANTPLNHSPFRKQLQLPKTRRTRAQRVGENQFEVTLIVEDFSRVRAMALRVEKIFTAWKITALEIA